MRQELLTLMGIQTWESRCDLPGAKTSISYEVFQLKKNGKTWGFLLLENSIINEEIDKLLASIMKAIDLEYAATNQDVKKDGYIIIMGKKLGERMQQQYPNAVITYHPEELIHNPSLKRDVWMTLKKFK